MYGTFTKLRNVIIRVHRRVNARRDDTVHFVFQESVSLRNIIKRHQTVNGRTKTLIRFNTLARENLIVDWPRDVSDGADELTKELSGRFFVYSDNTCVIGTQERLSSRFGRISRACPDACGHGCLTERTNVDGGPDRRPDGIPRYWVSSRKLIYRTRSTS